MLATIALAPSTLPDNIQFSAAVTAATPVVKADTTALDEMLVDASGQRQHWPSIPQLVVLTSVMDYHADGSSQYVATAEQLSSADATSLAADLTAALRLLTAGTFVEFATVAYEAVPAGSSVTIVRPNQIVVGRFHGVRRLADTIGFGGRKARRDGAIVAGAVVLDSEFDQVNPARRLLRTHELGHALGFNHVQSRVSIMNPSIGSEMTEHDRQISMLAFPRPARRIE